MQSRSNRVARRRKLSSQAKKRSTYPQFEDRSLWKAGGRPHFLFGFFLSGILCHIPRMDKYRRKAQSYLLSATSPRGRRRNQPIWLLSTVATARVMSWHRPSESTTAKGQPFPSTTAWRLLVEPPQVLPTSCPPFLREQTSIQWHFLRSSFPLNSSSARSTSQIRTRVPSRVHRLSLRHAVA